MTTPMRELLAAVAAIAMVLGLAMIIVASSSHHSSAPRSSVPVLANRGVTCKDIYRAVHAVERGQTQYEGAAIALAGCPPNPVPQP